MLSGAIAFFLGTLNSVAFPKGFSIGPFVLLEGSTAGWVIMNGHFFIIVLKAGEPGQGFRDFALCYVAER